MSKFEASFGPTKESMEKERARMYERYMNGSEMTETEMGWACWYMALSEDRQCYERLCKLLDDPDVRKRTQAFYHLHQSKFARKDARLYERLVGNIRSGDVGRALPALEALLQLEYALPDEVILFILRSYYERMDSYYMHVIHQLEDNAENKQFIRQMLQSEPYTERKGINEKRLQMAEFLAARATEQEAAALVVQLAVDPYAKIRLCAANLATRFHLEHLAAELKQDPNGHVRRAARTHI